MHAVSAACVSAVLVIWSAVIDLLSRITLSMVSRLVQLQYFKKIHFNVYIFVWLGSKVGSKEIHLLILIIVVKQWDRLLK